LRNSSFRVRNAVQSCPNKTENSVTTEARRSQSVTWRAKGERAKRWNHLPDLTVPTPTAPNRSPTKEKKYAQIVSISSSETGKKPDQERRYLISRSGGLGEEREVLPTNSTVPGVLRKRRSGILQSCFELGARVGWIPRDIMRDKQQEGRKGKRYETQVRNGKRAHRDFIRLIKRRNVSHSSKELEQKREILARSSKNQKGGPVNSVARQEKIK